MRAEREWANVFLEAKAAYAAAGAADVFAEQLSYALTHPMGILERGNGILLFAWWTGPETVYIARLDGPGVIGLRRGLQVIARDARMRGVPLKRVRVQWRRIRTQADRLSEWPWHICHRHLRNLWKTVGGK